MTEPEIPLAGGSHSIAVRVGATVRRAPRATSSAVLALLQHLEREGFSGAPRALGFDEQGREVLGYIEGTVAFGEQFIPTEGGRFDRRLPNYVWKDDVLVHLGALLRSYHDAAATFSWTGWDWAFEPQSPVETMCHNEIFPSNTVFQSGRPVAFIDWDTAAPGPRARDLGLAAWRWVPFARDDKCRAIGIETGVADKARRLRLLLDAYGVAPNAAIVRAGIARMCEILAFQRKLVAEGSHWELESARRGVLDELELEIAWVEEHAVALGFAEP